MSWFECVPNLSEGQNPRVIAALADAVQVSGVDLLDTSSDPDHHRTVLTLVGQPSALVEAIVRLFAAALPRIDLAVHRGVHPRIGAVDVVPVIPLAGATMVEAAALARTLGQAVGERFELPVFLYGEAATRDARRELADLRRGGLSGLARRLADPTWQPDFGPRHLHPTAGATAIGARDFLIAFNVLLASRDLAVAQQIAARVRASSGGLPGVKALGLFLPSRNQVQVSMNLIDYRQTSPAAAFAQVVAEAQRLGVQVVGSELVGLIPEAALAHASVAELALENFTPSKLLEPRLRALGILP